MREWLIGALLILLAASGQCASDTSIGSASVDSFCRAEGFKEHRVYESAREPGYTSWVSFFPGWNREWYITCEEVYEPEKPLTQASPEFWFSQVLPIGFDKSQYQMEVVMLKSGGSLRDWNVISRMPIRSMHTAGTYGPNARTRDGRFLRFVHPNESLDPDWKSNEVLLESKDEGKTWRKMPPFMDARVCSRPHRMHTLRDGTLVLACPISPRYGPGTSRPLRIAFDLDATNEYQMTLFFSFDQGRTWQGPTPVLPGQNVTETDFVELPGGDLLVFCMAFYGRPGTQRIYRDGKRFTPGLFKRVVSGTVPETVCITEDGILVGCVRNAQYVWSDDMGRTWHGLEGARAALYQPMIQYLGQGRIGCVGHFGGDDPIALLGKNPQYNYRQYIGLQTFSLKVLQRTRDSELVISRDYDEANRRWLNGYTVSLLSGGTPVPDKEIEFWYVERWPGGEGDNPAAYDSLGNTPLDQRIKLGGTLLRSRTGADGKVHFALPELDRIRDTNVVKQLHHSIQIVARFNTDRRYAEYKPYQTEQMEMYTICMQDPTHRRKKMTSSAGTSGGSV